MTTFGNGLGSAESLVIPEVTEQQRQSARLKCSEVLHNKGELKTVLEALGLKAVSW